MDWYFWQRFLELYFLQILIFSIVGCIFLQSLIQFLIKKDILKEKGISYWKLLFKETIAVVISVLAYKAISLLIGYNFFLLIFIVLLVYYIFEDRKYRHYGLENGEMLIPTLASKTLLITALIYFSSLINPEIVLY